MIDVEKAEGFMPTTAISKRERGVTLTEVAMALIISIVVGSLAFLYFNTGSIAQQTDQAISQLAAVENAVHGLYGGQADYSAVSVAQLVSLKQLPPSMITGTNGLQNSFKGSISVTPAAGNSTFVVTFNGVPTEACAKLSVLDLGSGGVNVSVGGTNYVPRATVADAATSCATAPVTIAWTLQ